MRRAERVVCEACGNEFVTRLKGARFCSHKCANGRSKTGGRSRFQTACPFNKAVICDEKKCGSCGWNPKVAQLRKEAMML